MPPQMDLVTYLTSRSSNLASMKATHLELSTLTGSTLNVTTNITVPAVTASTIIVSTINGLLPGTGSVSTLTSTIVSIGASTNQTYRNFTNGSYLTWATAKEAMSSANKTVQSANGLYQMIVGNATSGLFLSSDSGITWSTLTGGLPTLTGNAYWSDGAISANGQYITLSICGGSLWMSADYGRTFALTNQPTPNIWLPLNGSTTDSMGLSVVTTPGTVPGYVTLNYPGYTAQAVNLLNTAGAAATRYIRGTWTGSPNFTVSLWFNAQSLTSVYQNIFSAYAGAFVITIANNNTLYAQIPSGGAFGISNMGFTSALTVNTWYYVTVMYQTNGLCSFYVNNVLIGSVTNSQGVGSFTTTQFSLGSFDTSTTLAFNGYINDLRITNSVSTYVPIPLLQPNIWMPFENTAGDLGSYSLPPSATPTIYLPFEGNLTDSMGFSTVTAPGTVPGYVAANREGYTGQAVNLLNTVGSNATRYVRGTWSGSANFTVSFWVNPQSLTGVQQQVFAAYSGSMVVYITSSNQLAWYIPSGGGINAVTMGTTSFTLVTNTWYYVTIIFQTSGVCSFYVNNALIATYTNVSGVGTLTTTQFSLGCNDNSFVSSFNGYIDDLRIYNSAIPYVPVSVTTVTGSLSYVPGVVGLNAVNLVNTASGTATNYVTGFISPGNNFTISGWFNAQSLSGGVCVVLRLANSSHNFVSITCNTSNIGFGYWTGSADVTIGTLVNISVNTWYHFVLIVSIGGTGYAYVNGQSVGSAAVTGLGGTIDRFILGANTGSPISAFNGYIDDFRIYNAAIPIHVLFPQNYRSLALSGTGQYAIASAASGWVVGSSDSLRTWAKQAVTVGTQSDFIQPNLSGLTATTWTKNGVTWTASESSNNGATQSVSRAFNNNTTTDAWLSNNTTQRYTAGATNANAASTNIQTIGATAGEWIQIESSIPMVLASFAFGIGLNAYGVTNTPKTYYIVGSTDGTTWVPLQFGNFTISAWTFASSNITMNITGTQTLAGNMVGSVATTAYPSYTLNAYRYFRLIGTSLMLTGPGGTYMEVGEWYLNFVRPLTDSRPPTHALSMNHTGQYQMVATGPAAGSIMPNSTLAMSNTWTVNGVTWTSSGSSSYVTIPNIYYVLFNTASTAEWVSSAAVYNTSGNTSGFNTTFYTNGSSTSTIQGDYIQLQSSIPFVMSSYQLANSGEVINFIKSFYIVGSNDGTTWYAIQYSIVAAQPTAVASTFLSNTILVNNASAQTFGTSTMTTTTYTGTTNSYTYFRMIIVSTYNPSAYYARFSEWLINFQNSVSYSTNYGATWLNTSPTVSNESVALSPSGQYALSTNSVVPFARLTLDNTNLDAQSVLAPTTGAGTVTYSTSIKAVGSHSAQFANTAGGNVINYLNYTVPAVFNKPPALTMSCWVYPSGLSSSGSVPVAFNNGGTTAGPYISCWSNRTECSIYNTSGGGIYASYSSPVSINAWTHLAMTFNIGILTLYVNGISRATTTTSNITLNLSTNNNITNLFLGGLWTSSGYAFEGNIDDVRLYTSALSADEINGLFKNPALTQTIAISNSYLPITTYTEPTLPGITANVVDTAVSQTGQYMVAVTSSTTNNVYYSTDFGATFTALTVGSSAMVSCSISYDGSYLTVSTATTTYTLNRNTRGFSVTVGNQAGLVNQAQNAIAIGNQAGRTNQSANSIVLNATGNALDAVAPGFYVAPIGTTTSSNATSFALLGYGSDSQIVQSSALTVLQNGNVSIGTVNYSTPSTTLNVFGTTPYSDMTANPMKGGLVINTTTGGERLILGAAYTGGVGSACYIQSSDYWSGIDHGQPLILNPLGGNVGIGVTSPSHLLHMFGASPSITTQCNNFYQTTRILLQAYDTNRFSYLSQEETGSLTQILRLGVTNNYGAGIAKQINLETDGSAKLIVHSSAVQTIHLGPQLDNTYDLGWVGVRWRAVWAVNGTIQTSDSNVKDAVPLSYGMNEILQMRTIKYKWKSQADLPDDDPNKNFEYYGFCADELAPLFPELVYNEDTSAPVQMNYSELLPVVVNALKEEHASAVVLKATVDSQAEKIVSLQTKLDALLTWAQTQGFSGAF